MNSNPIKVWLSHPKKTWLETYGGLHRDIYILFLARIINQIGGFVHAFLALFLSTKLFMTPNQIADFIILTGVLTTAAPFIGGTIADRKGRKLIYILAQGSAAALYIPCGFLAVSHPHYIPFLLIGASFLNNVVGPINSAMVADLTQTEVDRKRAFSLLYLGINLGVAIGPLIGGLLLEKYVQWFFFGDAMTTFISLFLVIFFVHETKLTHTQMAKIGGKEKQAYGMFFKVLLQRPLILQFTGVSILISVVFAQRHFGLSLYMNKLYGIGGGERAYGMLMSLNAVIVLLFTIAITEILKKNSPVANMFIGALLYGIGFGAIGLVGDRFIAILICVACWSIGEIITITNQGVFVMSHSPVNFRGRFIALLGLITGTGYILSPKWMSFMVSTFSFQTAWLIVGLVALIAALGYKWIARIEKKHQVLLENPAHGYDEEDILTSHEHQ